MSRKSPQRRTFGGFEAYEKCRLSKQKQWETVNEMLAWGWVGKQLIKKRKVDLEQWNIFNFPSFSLINKTFSPSNFSSSLKLYYSIFKYFQFQLRNVWVYKKVWQTETEQRYSSFFTIFLFHKNIKATQL